MQATLHRLPILYCGRYAYNGITTYPGFSFHFRVYSFTWRRKSIVTGTTYKKELAAIHSRRFWWSKTVPLHAAALLRHTERRLREQDRTTETAIMAAMSETLAATPLSSLTSGRTQLITPSKV
jgi:hypothetical protein